jgi:hypothetical protein
MWWKKGTKRGIRDKKKPGGSFPWWKFIAADLYL